MRNTKERLQRTSVVRSAAIVVLTASLATACSTTPSNPNPRASQPIEYANVDLPRYMGKWYIVAHVPYFLEKNFVASQTEYTLRDDGKVVEHFSARKGGFDGEWKRYEFVNTPDPATGNAYWSVRLFWPVYASQVTLHVDDNYDYTLIGTKDKGLGWIYSRRPDLSETKYRELLQKFEAQGYDTSRFRRVVQHPDQLDRPGFDSPEK